MKKYILPIIILCFSIFVLSCNTNEDETTLSVNPKQVTMPANGFNTQFTINTQGAWSIQKSSDAAWLTINPSSGTGMATINLIAEPSATQRSAKIVVMAGNLKQEMTVSQSAATQALPADASTITGVSTNDCALSSTVQLSTTAISFATSYKWYKDGNIIATTTTPVYEAETSGAYVVAGANQAGEGTPSPEKRITVNVCPPPDAAGTISGYSGNTCPVTGVILTVAPINHAQSYQWYKDGNAVSGATASTYNATATGTYTVAGVNRTGVGTQSAPKEVTITPCPLALSDLVGTWQVTEGLTPSTATVGETNYQVTIELGVEEGEDVLYISGLARMSAGVKADVVGLVSILNGEDGTVVIPAQVLPRSWNSQYPYTVFCAVVGNGLGDLPAAVIKKTGGEITITFANDATPITEEAPYGATYRVGALDASEAYQGHFTIRNSTVMRKISSSVTSSTHAKKFVPVSAIPSVMSSFQAIQVK